MLQKALNLHVGDVGVDANARSFATRAIGANIGFELLVRPRLREQVLQLVQMQPPTGAGLGDFSSEKVNKYRTSTRFSAPHPSFSNAHFGHERQGGSAEVAPHAWSR